VRRADNLTTFMCRLSRNLGASTSWNPHGLSTSLSQSSRRYNDSHFKLGLIRTLINMSSIYRCTAIAKKLYVITNPDIYHKINMLLIFVARPEKRKKKLAIGECKVYDFAIKKRNCITLKTCTRIQFTYIKFKCTATFCGPSQITYFRKKENFAK
jgi:hypothetical protein